MPSAPAPDLDAHAFSAVVLAGGTAVRLDGVDKSSLEIGGHTLLDIALDALIDAHEVVVVGPRTVSTTRPATFVREYPPRGGPAAGLLTGVDALAHAPDAVGVLAVDMPGVEASTFRRLRAAAAGHDGAFLHEPGGRRQLCGVLTAAALRRVRPEREDQHGMSVGQLLSGLDLASVGGSTRETRDVDTWDDVRHWSEQRPSGSSARDHRDDGMTDQDESDEEE